jgi:hypothetical protein
VAAVIRFEGRFVLDPANRARAMQGDHCLKDSRLSVGIPKMGLKAGSTRLAVDAAPHAPQKR